MMIVQSRDLVAVELVALVLIFIGQQSVSLATSSNFDQNNLSINNNNNNNDDPKRPNGADLGPGEQTHQVQYEGNNNNNNNLVQGNNQDNNLRQYLLKEADLDLDGYTLSKPTAEQWRWFQLSKLLDQLSSSIPTQAPPLAPIYRTGRTYPSVGYAGYSSQGNDYASSRSSIPTLRLAMPNAPIGYNPSQNLAPRESQKARKQSVLGIDWGGSRPTGSSALVTVRRSQSLANGQGLAGGLMDRSQQHHPMGTGEVAIHTPMHSRSTNDYEWKRVENLSKWNNLRGMWGKRASNSAASDSIEEPTSAAGASATTTNGPYQYVEDQLV